MEVEYHHLTFEVAQTADGSFIVWLLNIDDGGGGNLTQFDGLLTPSFQDAHILHALNGNVMQVLSAKGVGVISVPAGGYSGKGLDIFLALARIENQHVTQCLEQGEIRGGHHRLLVDVVTLHIVLEDLHQAHNTVVGGLKTHVIVALQGNGTVLQVDLLLCELLDPVAVLRPLHLVVEAHGRIGGLDFNGFGGIDAEVDDLIGNTQTIELWSLNSIAGEAETARFIEFDRVHNHGSVKTHILEIQCRVFGLGNGSVDVELSFGTGSEGKCDHSKGQRLQYSPFHIFSFLFLFLDLIICGQRYIFFLTYRTK